MSNNFSAGTAVSHLLMSWPDGNSWPVPHLCLSKKYYYFHIFTVSVVTVLAIDSAQD